MSAIVTTKFSEVQWNSVNTTTELDFNSVHSSKTKIAKN